MSRPASAVLPLAFALLAASVLRADDEDGDVHRPLRALLLSGGCCHDYPSQDRILSEGISARAPVEWKIVRGPKGRNARNPAYSGPGWAEGYDVVVHNECYGAEDDVEYVESIARAHRTGTAAVVIHCSMHSYRAAPSDTWQRFLGVTSRSHEGHRPVTVRTLRSEHPILAGFPDGWRTPNGELYKIEKIWPRATPLAQAWGEDTEKDHCVIWTNRYGDGRVFGTTLGHHNATMSHEVYLDLVTRGLLWSVGKLAEDGSAKEGWGAEAAAALRAEDDADEDAASPRAEGSGPGGERDEAGSREGDGDGDGGEGAPEETSSGG